MNLSQGRLLSDSMGFLDRGSSLQMLRRARTHRSKHQFGMCFVSWMQPRSRDDDRKRRTKSENGGFSSNHHDS